MLTLLSKGSVHYLFLALEVIHSVLDRLALVLGYLAFIIGIAVAYEVYDKKVSARVPSLSAFEAREHIEHFPVEYFVQVEGVANDNQPHNTAATSE